MDLSEGRKLAPMTAADALRKAKATLADPTMWWHGNHLPQDTGGSCPVLAMAWLGADEHTTLEALRKFARAIDAPFNDLAFLYQWNDAPERTHDDVMRAFDRAIELAG